MDLIERYLHELDSQDEIFNDEVAFPAWLWEARWQNLFNEYLSRETGQA